MKIDAEEQKVRFVVAAARREKPLSALCEEFGISRPTGYLWWRRYEEAGLAGICERSRRPKQSPQRTAAELERRVVELRQRYPDWGARKLQVLLARERVEMTRSTVHRILLRHHQVRDSDRHRQAPGRFQRGTPNELWQMDFKSPKGWNAAVGPLSVLDDCSRYLLVLQAVWTNHGDLVREQLASAFTSSGVPQAMLMDHGIPWWSERAPSGATHLTVWLMKQGIQLHWSGFRHPQTQGKVERFHGALERALRLRAAPRQQPQAWTKGTDSQGGDRARPRCALGQKRRGQAPFARGGAYDRMLVVLQRAFKAQHNRAAGNGVVDDDQSPRSQFLEKHGDNLRTWGSIPTPCATLERKRRGRIFDG